MIYRVLRYTLVLCLGAVAEAIHNLANLAVLGLLASTWLLLALVTIGTFHPADEESECWFCQEAIDADEPTCPYCEAAQC